MPNAHFKFWPPHAMHYLTAPATNLFYNAEVSARRYPDKPYLVFYDTLISFSEFHDEATRVAGYLQKKLGVAPGIKSWADLKGKAIELGTKQDVTAIALGSMAAAQKLTLDDFNIIIGGNSTARFAALTGGSVQGAMLAQPYDLVAESKGYPILAIASDTIKDWAFTCVAVNNGWAAQNRPLVLKFMRALRKGIQYGYTHKAEAVAALVAQTHAEPAIAAKAWDIDFGKWKAFDPNLKLSTTAMQSIGKYQIDFKVIPSMPAMSEIYDPSFAADALK